MHVVVIGCGFQGRGMAYELAAANENLVGNYVSFTFRLS